MQISTKAGTRNLVVGGSMAALFASITALIVIPMTVRDALSSRFLPHDYCYL